MKRVKTVSATDNDRQIKITIELETGGSLSRDEADHMVNSMASQCMHVITQAPYSRVTLSKVKVS